MEVLRTVDRAGLRIVLRTDSFCDSSHLAMATLIIRNEVVLLGQSRQDSIPHFLVRHERVDEDEPRGVVVSLGDADM